MADFGRSEFTADLFAALPEPEKPAKLLAAASPQDRVTPFVLVPCRRGAGMSGAGVTTEFTPLDRFITRLRESNVFSTASRNAFFTRFGEQLIKLDRTEVDARLRGRGHCGVIVAQRGSGKSYLLKQLMVVGRETTSRTFFCYLNYKTAPSAATATPLTPVQSFTKLAVAEEPRLQPHLKEVSNVDELNVVLEHLGFRAVFLVDEIEIVYGMDAGYGVPILSELIAIGELDGRRALLAYVTGTSSKVRRLCFTKMALVGHEARDLPSYNKQCDFNGRKYDAITLGPIETLAELQDAMSCMRLCRPAPVPAADRAGAAASAPPAAAGAGADDTDVGDLGAPAHAASLREAFLDSRGVAQALDDLLNTTSGGSKLLNGFAEIKRSDPTLHTVWRTMLEFVQGMLGAEGFAHKLHALADCVYSAALPMVPFRYIAGSAPSIAESCVWDYADKGLLRAEADAKVDGGLAVGFIHVSDFLWAVRNLGDFSGGIVTRGNDLKHRELTDEEKDYFLHPSGKTGHERLFAEALAFGYTHPAVAVSFSFKWRSCALASDQRKADINVWEPSAWTGEIFTCIPDLFGADLVAFVDNGMVAGTRRLQAICWQCKTGNSDSIIGPKSGNHTAVKIIKRYTDRGFGAVESLIAERSGISTTLTVDRVVVTTCYIAPTGEARTLLAGASIKVLERNDLLHMWTPRIRRFLDSDTRVSFMLDP